MKLFSFISNLLSKEKPAKSELQDKIQRRKNDRFEEKKKFFFKLQQQLSHLSQ